MKIRFPEEKTKVSCSRCQSFQPGTWRYGTLVMDDGTEIEQVMQAYCDVCEAPCSMATQSAWKLREAREEKEKVRTSFRVSLPLLDLSAATISEFGGEAKRGPELIAQAVFRRLAREPGIIPTFAANLKTMKSPLLKRSSMKMNLSLTSGLARVLEKLREETSLSQSEIIRRALIAHEADPGFRDELKALVDG